jgi:hypothetical protein
MVIIAFGVSQVLASGYALWRGGAPERSVALMLLAAAFASWSIPFGHMSFHSVFWPVFWIDLILLIGLTTIAIFADRFWPIWIAACQFMTVAGHGVRAYEPEMWATAYWFIIGSIAYPMLAILVVGAWRHQRRLLQGREFAWTMQRHRYEQAELQL